MKTNILSRFSLKKFLKSLIDNGLKYFIHLWNFAEEHFEKDKTDSEILIQFLHGMPIKPLLCKQLLDDSIRFSWNFLFLAFQFHLPIFTLSLIPFIIKFSPSQNLINEKGNLHEIKSKKSIIHFLNLMDVFDY